MKIIDKIFIVVVFLSFFFISGCLSCIYANKEVAPNNSTIIGKHEYFKFLSSLPECIKSVSLRTWSEIDKNMAARKLKNRTGNTIYDESIDAVRFTVLSGKGSVKIGDTMRISLPEISTGTLMLIWESRWDRNYPYNLFGLRANKSFQLAHHGRGDKRRIEIRSIFKKVSAPHIAYIDLRRYVWEAPGRDQSVPGQLCDFIIKGETWTRYWALVDFENKQFSLWVADENTNPKTLFYRLKFTKMNGGLNKFWFEHNSSQKRDGGKDLYIWGRNFIALHNVKDAEKIVAMGAIVSGNK